MAILIYTASYTRLVMWSYAYNFQLTVHCSVHSMVIILLLGTLKSELIVN